MSRAVTLWVSQPIEIKSTPVAAIARADALVVGCALNHGTGEAELFGPYVVGGHGIPPHSRGLLEVGRRVALALALHQMANPRAPPFDRRSDAPSRGDVVVFDEHGI